jgi:hypothetical protein
MLDQFEGSGTLGLDWRDHTQGALEKACRAAPEEAWTRLLPILLRSIRLFRRMRSAPEEDLAKSLDPGFPLRGLKKINYQLRILLSEAGAELARRLGLDVLDLIAPLFAMRSKSAQCLVLYLFLKGPDDLADFALQWLYVDPRRLQGGSFKDASRYEPARLLIGRFAGLCSAEVYQELEAGLMTFRPESEMRTIRYRHERFRATGPLTSNEYGRAQHILLSALPRSRMSGSACHRLDAWQRKFGEPYRGRRSGAMKGPRKVVRSSIPYEKLRLVSDEQWLSIIRRDWRERQKSDWRRDPLLEVSHEQFARVFGVAAHLEPERFIRLALRVPPGAPSVYFSALLSALDDKPPTLEEGALADWRPAPISRIEEVLRYIEGSLPDKEIARAVCRLVRERVTEPWPDWVLNLLRGYVESHPEPRGLLALDAEYQEDIEIALETSVRGVAAETLLALVFEKPELAEIFFPTIEKIASDPNPVMRVAAQGLCISFLEVDRDRAIRLFLQSCEHPDDRVLAGAHTSQFLASTWNRHPDDLAPLLDKMIESDNETAAEIGAFWATVGQVSEGLYGGLAARCLAGGKAQRKGAAEAMAQLLGRPESKQALRGLLELLRNSDDAADHEVADLLREEEILGSPEGPKLAEAYVRSSAMEDDPGDLFYGLQNFTGSLVPYASILLEAVQRLGGGLASGTRDLSTRLSGAVSFLPEILLRLYEQAEDPELKSVRSTCLDAWDSLLRGQVGLSWDVLRKLDA